MSNKLSKYNDKELVEMLKGSSVESEQAFTEIYERFAAKIYAYCIKVVQNKEEAEDIFQETFTRFYQSVYPEHENLHIQRFLITIARNLCLNHKRNRKSTVPVEDVEFLLPVNQSYERKEMAELVKLSMDLLEEIYREPLILRVYNGFQYDEIAEILGVTEGNARIRVYRAKDKLKKILEPYVNDMNK